MRSGDRNAGAGPAPARRYEGCFGCGRANPYGLQMSFEVDEDTVRAEFTPDERHQGYPGLLHGGILYSLLDELMGQAATVRQVWVMTGRLEIRYLAPIPIGRRLLLSSRIVRERGRAFEMTGEAHLDDGTPVARASGLFMKIPDDLLRDVSTNVDAEQVERFGR